MACTFLNCICACIHYLLHINKNENNALIHKVKNIEAHDVVFRKIENQKQKKHTKSIETLYATKKGNRLEIFYISYVCMYDSSSL